jgi:hypothetical protein
VTVVTGDVEDLRHLFHPRIAAEQVASSLPVSGEKTQEGSWNCFQ